MKIVDSLSKTDLINQDLTRQILSGRYPIGSRLPNMRALAKHYNVSIRIIHIVLKQLEEKRLLLIEHGKGAYVVNYKDSCDIECYFLIWGIDVSRDKYHTEMTRMIYPPYLENGFYFTVRAVFDKKLSVENLKKELSFIDMLTDVRCLLINSITVSPETLELLEKLRCPVIFLGDSQHLEINNTLSHHITGDNEMLGYNTIRFLLTQTTKGSADAIDLFYPRHFYYHELYIHGAERAAKEFGIKLNFHDITPAFLQNSVKKAYDDFEQNLEDGKLRHHTIIHPFAPESENHIKNLLAQTPQDRMAITNSYYQEGMENFYHMIFDRIRQIIKNPQAEFKDIVPIPFMINDLISGVSYGCSPDGRTKRINPDFYYTYYY